jgi:hypothetical protein
LFALDSIEWAATAMSTCSLDHHAVFPATRPCRYRKDGLHQSLEGGSVLELTVDR